MQLGILKRIHAFLGGQRDDAHGGNGSGSHCQPDDVECFMTNGIERRRGQRLPLEGLYMRLASGLMELPVLDVGCHGLGVRNNGWRIESGALLHVDLFMDHRPVIKNLTVRVTRANDESFGCVYENLGLIDAGKLFRLATLMHRRDAKEIQEAENSGVSFPPQD